MLIKEIFDYIELLRFSSGNFSVEQELFGPAWYFNLQMSFKPKWTKSWQWQNFGKKYFNSNWAVWYQNILLLYCMSIFQYTLLRMLNIIVRQISKKIIQCNFGLEFLMLNENFSDQLAFSSHRYFSNLRILEMAKTGLC